MLRNRMQRLSGRAALRPSERLRTKHSASGLAAPAAQPRGRQVLPTPASGASEGDALGRRRAGFWHLHRYTWFAEDQFSGHNLYACRCGRVRPGL